MVTTVILWFHDHLLRSKRESLCPISECPLCDLSLRFAEMQEL